MKITLEVCEEQYENISKELKQLGIEIDEEAELVLSQKNAFVDYLMVLDVARGEWCRLHAEEIIFIESFGHDVEVHTIDKKYKINERLYRLQSLLDPQKFLRISNSVIIAVDSVKRVKPTFSSKFILTLSDGTVVDVTRSYYNLFKEYYHL